MCRKQFVLYLMYIFHYLRNVVYRYCQCNSCTVRNSNVANAPMNTVFLVKALPLFTCDNPFSFRDING